MKATLLALGTILMACYTVAGPYDDAQVYLQSSHIKGVWVQVIEEESDVPGLYRKDTIIYRIDMDKLPEDMLPYDPDTYEPYKKPMSFVTIFDRGESYAFIHDPEEDYDYDERYSLLHFKVVEGLPTTRSKSSITFAMPQTDSLWVQRGVESFGLRRKR